MSKDQHRDGGNGKARQVATIAAGNSRPPIGRGALTWARAAGAFMEFRP
jgi:hypothetical protein